VEKLLETTRTLQKKLEALRVEEAVSGIEDYLSQAKTVGGIKVFARIQEGLSRDGLRQLVDELKAKMKSGIVVLGAVSNGKVCLLTGITNDLVKQGWHAGKLVKEMASIVEGSGGGRADFAQAGGKNVHRLKEAIEAVPEIIKDRLQTSDHRPKDEKSDKSE
jgi:alanyl-tRNA synthetase